MRKQDKILAIVPAYNESNNIRKVILDLKKHCHNADVLLVNDCSTDKTYKIADKYADYIVDLPINLGIGGAVQTGFVFARDNNYDIAFQFDGDGQHNAEEVKILIDSIQSGNADVVIGSRFLREDEGFKSTVLRRIGIKIFSFINSLLIKQYITDNTSGFRAYNLKAIKFLSDNYPSDYPEPEAVIMLGKKNFKILEVPVLMKKREKGKSSITGVYSFYYMIKVLLAIFMTSTRE